MTIFKKLLPFAFLLPVFSINASDGGNIGITGIIAASGCDFAVTSGTWAIGRLFTTGTGNIGDALTERKGILSLNLSRCPVGSYVAIAINGEADDNDPSLFKAVGDGSAKGVAFKIETGNPTIGYTQIIPGQRTNYYQVTSTSSNTTATYAGFGRFNATLVVTDSKLETGSLDTTIVYTVAYY